MSISDKDRKQLWAKSGNRCAICKEELFHANETGVGINIGEECHIISSTPGGPRYDANYGKYDTYQNLILLCCKHHKEIDDKNNIVNYPPQKLHDIKLQHEEWVSERLDIASKKKEKDWNAIFRALDLT